MRGEFTNKYRQQAVFELLGQDYTKVHFPHHEVRYFHQHTPTYDSPIKGMLS